MACTASLSKYTGTSPSGTSAIPASLVAESGSPSGLAMPWATSTRKPSTPRSSQNRRIPANSSWTRASSQLQSGWVVSNRRSEERRVGKEGRDGGGGEQERKRNWEQRVQ